MSGNGWHKFILFEIFQPWDSKWKFLPKYFMFSKIHRRLKLNAIYNSHLIMVVINTDLIWWRRRWFFETIFFFALFDPTCWYFVDALVCCLLNFSIQMYSVKSNFLRYSLTVAGFVVMTNASVSSQSIRYWKKN